MKVVSVNISQEKGTVKRPVDSITVNERGIAGDAHAGAWHRQVSLLSRESIEKFEREAGRKVECGEFAENLTTEGLDLGSVALLDRFAVGEVILEVTQIGKKCHGDDCAIFREVGKCVMPKEGIFCRVVKGGEIRPGAEIRYLPYTLGVSVITLSDRAYRGEYEDLSGPRIKELVEDYFSEKSKSRWRVSCDVSIVPDDAQALRTAFLAACETCALVFTTGGTGIGPKDITPDVIAPLLDKEIPGIMDFIRNKYGAKHPNALISRSIAGVKDGALVFCLPGSVRAVTE